MSPIQNFLDFISLEKRYSYNTIKSYQTDLKLFESYLKNTYDISIEKTDHNMTRSWLVNEIKKEIPQGQLIVKSPHLSLFLNIFSKVVK